jgi:hypothetical protein
MSTKRLQAQDLRILGMSYSEIQAKLGISKSTLSIWLRDVKLSGDARLRLEGRARQGVLNGLVKRNKEQTSRAYERAKAIRQAACRDVHVQLRKNLFLIGVTLYWAEGYKRLRVINGVERTGHAISFVNADPDAIRIFLRFLIEELHVDRSDILINMRLYKSIDEDNAKKYWKKVTTLTDKNFRSRTTYLVSSASKGIRPANRLPYGTLQVEVYDTEKFHRLLGWIEGVKKNW